MLSKPRYGWTDVTLGHFTAPASYLTDVPNEILDALICGYKHWVNPSVTFDAEGYTYTLVLSMYDNCAYVILEQNETSILVFDIDVNSLAYEVIEDIESDIVGWAKFYFTCNRRLRAWRLKRKTRRLRKLLESNASTKGRY